MPINDQEIDLTSGNRFHLQDWQKNRHANEAFRRISTGKFFKAIRPPVIEEAIYRIESLPWRKKASECHALHAKRLRRTEDYISNEANCVIRSTSSNTIMQLGSSEDYIRHEEVMEEFFLETLGYIPFTSIHRCWRCGSLYISTVKEVPIFCRTCEFDGLPWSRMTTR